MPTARLRRNSWLLPIRMAIQMDSFAKAMNACCAPGSMTHGSSGSVDQQKKLSERIPDLAKVTFQAKLGSYKDKTDRVVEARRQNWPPKLAPHEDTVARAALFRNAISRPTWSKNFPELQGIVGGLYAKAQGESEAVATAIYDHYKPRQHGRLDSADAGRSSSGACRQARHTAGVLSESAWSQRDRRIHLHCGVQLRV